ncbi:MAG: zinc ABC transporter solute-binding protein [Gammaproteobacteria bacterium]|nr:zinc ABC transporter solute-binding protein [Gammaproteobacteria bacterium]
MRYLLILMCCAPVKVFAELTVLTSIAPLQALTATLMLGAGAPEVLIDNQQSAHHFAFRPSHLRALQRADLVIWIDRNFESGFQNLPDILPQATTSLELLPLLGLHNQDGHIWYSPTYLRKIVNIIAQALSELDPAHQSLFQQNKQSLQLAIKAWDASTRESFTRQEPQYILDHNFLVHFEADFQIKTLATINNQHGQQSGIQTLKKLERTLTQTPAKCLLANEPGISKVGRSMAAQFDLAVYQLIITAGVEPGKLMQHLHHLSDTLEQCK